MTRGHKPTSLHGLTGSSSARSADAPNYVTQTLKGAAPGRATGKKFTFVTQAPEPFVNRHIERIRAHTSSKGTTGVVYRNQSCATVVHSTPAQLVYLPEPAEAVPVRVMPPSQSAQTEPDQKEDGRIAGSRIVLITTNEIRYEGLICDVDAVTSMVTLENARCFGTEDRPAEQPVPASAELIDYISFAGSGIKDLQVFEWIAMPTQSSRSAATPMAATLISGTRVE